jgi:hypothetical protein
MFTMSLRTDVVERWLKALDERHLANLSFAEVRRAVQALSSLYVERRDRLGKGTALDGAGKRAAFAFFFGPLHFLLVQEIVQALGADRVRRKRILDVGCGTGIAGAAWALSMDPSPPIIGLDRHSWALQEARWTYATLGLRGTIRNQDLRTLSIPDDTAVIAAFAINELPAATREYVLAQCLRAAGRGSPVLVVEPIARRLTSWWDNWAREIKAVGGREDRWRFRRELPERLALMDRAAGLNHREQTGRSLWLPGTMLKSPGHDDLLSEMRPPEH